MLAESTLVWNGSYAARGVLRGRPVAVVREVVVSPKQARGARTFTEEELLARAELTRRDAKRMDRFSLLALAAVRELTGSIAPGKLASCGFVCGNMMAGWTFTEPQLRALHTDGPLAVSPYLASAWFPAAPQGQVSIHAGLHGYAKSIVTDRCAGSQAIAHAAQRIAAGRAEWMIAGGVESPVTPFVEAAVRQSGQRPEVLSEAAAFLLLAPAEVQAAHERGAAMPAPSVTVRAHRTLTIGRQTTAAAAACQIATLWEQQRFKVPRVVVCACGAHYAHRVLATSIVHELFGSRRPEIAFPDRDFGETLGASSAIAATLAHQSLIAGTAEDTALVLSLGHFSIDALWLQRSA